MQNKKIIILFLLALAFKFSPAQRQDAILSYIAKYKALAISEMQRTGVPAAITLAQGIHETDAGTSELVAKSNNHFGIKCKTNWTGESVSHDDDAKGECFRKYPVADQSYRDHSDFLKSSQRYAFLFQLDPMDFESWAYGLKKAGYATNPRYSEVLIKLIRDYNLQDYTLIAMGKMKDQPMYAKNDQSQQVTNTIGEDSRIVIGSSSKMAVSQVSVIPAVSMEINYPTGEFKINDTRVLFVQEGTSFLTIAEQYELPLARLFEFNDMKPQDVAADDQLVFIQRKRKTGAHEFHVMQAGETIYSVSQSEAVRLESILEYNLLQPGMQPAAGETIYLRNKAAAMPKLAEKEKPAVAFQQPPARQAMVRDNSDQRGVSKNNYLTHVVQPKETVYSIAKKYEVNFADVMDWNKLQGYDLKIGQSLKIYK